MTVRIDEFPVPRIASPIRNIAQASDGSVVFNDWGGNYDLGYRFKDGTFTVLLQPPST